MIREGVLEIEDRGPRSPGPEMLLVIGVFFFNTLFLPHGLLYTTLLTPFFLLWIVRGGKGRFLLWFLVLTLPLFWYHLRQGADRMIYLRSYLLFFSVVLFAGWTYVFLKEHGGRLGHFFRSITLYNAIMTGIAAAAFFIPLIRNWFWSFEPIHPAIPALPRLKLLGYEPSFYAFQLAPVFLYYFLTVVLLERRSYLSGLAALLISLLLSLSFGVIGGLLFAIVLVGLWHIGLLLRRRRLFFTTLYLTGMLVVVLMMGLHFFPMNPLAERLDFVLAGHDTSANGRTWEAFLLAWRILGQTDYVFGAGLGQIKLAGQAIITDYYAYEGLWADLVRLPNAMAEILATFGIAGAVARLIAQIMLFAGTRVYTNYYRLILFTFLFIYQFTGSYLTNVYEYLAWVIVFLPVFPQFDQQILHRQ